MTSRVLVCVSMASEGNLSDPSHDLDLGVVPRGNWRVLLRDVRCILRKEFHEVLPSSVQYQFLTHRGWHILAKQEEEIYASEIIHDDRLRIIHAFGNLRVGVQIGSGTPIGFVFIRHNATAWELRDAIKTQLGSIQLQGGSSTYQLLDRNDWPVSPEQEDVLRIMDLLKSSGHVVVVPQVFRQKSLTLVSSQPSGDAMDGIQATRTCVITEVNSPALWEKATPPTVQRRSTRRQLTFGSSKDLERFGGTTMTSKDILISYVRAEAAQHAVFLKEQLLQLGFSVFLDVHEIKTGTDWQDSLNFAVSHCEVFLPLVTPRYGETQWTNREVKLADVLSKFILPVSFLDYWPPRCLAIQFATTQFIPSLPLDGGAEGQHSPRELTRRWDNNEAVRVAKLLAERIHNHLQQQQEEPLKRSLTLRSCPAPLPEGFQELSQNRQGKPLLVISVHPKQRLYAENLQRNLESENFEVWLSLALTDQTNFDLESVSSQDSLGDSEGLQGLSQCSAVDGQQCHKNHKFQLTVDEAGLVLLILSKAYVKSKTCKQQVFYCEHRKKIIPIQYEQLNMPCWLNMLIGGDQPLQSSLKKEFPKELQQRILEVLHADADPVQKAMEEQIRDFAQKLQLDLPSKLFVYIAGGTKFYCQRSEEICRVIGKKLASFVDLHVATGGFYGVGETVAVSYNDTCIREGTPANLWHVLPHRDKEDQTHRARQRKDKTFEAVPHGQTIFYGNSVWERERIVSRVFDTCILVEGGPGAAHEAEQFAWNDRIVIPIKSTGGAASGKFNVPLQIFEVPEGVSPSDWDLLNDQLASPEDIAEAVVNIICAVHPSTGFGQNNGDTTPTITEVLDTASLATTIKPKDTEVKVMQGWVSKGVQQKSSSKNKRLVGSGLNAKRTSPRKRPAAGLDHNTPSTETKKICIASAPKIQANKQPSMKDLFDDNFGDSYSDNELLLAVGESPRGSLQRNSSNTSSGFIC